MEAKERLSNIRQLYLPVGAVPNRAAAKSLYEARVAARSKALRKKESIAAKAAIEVLPVLTPVLTSIPAVTDLVVAPRQSQVMELFGSFFLCGQEFALPANCIREVVNFPEKV